MVARELQLQIHELDLPNLPDHHFYARLMTDGVPSKLFHGPNDFE